MRVGSLGPLSLEEHQALLFNILWVSSHQGAIDWPNIVAQTAGARHMVRHHAEDLVSKDAESAVVDSDSAAGDVDAHTLGGGGNETGNIDGTNATTPRH